MEAKRLIVVLGMHRSGTSAVTRGLQVMGVELGDRLMPPAEGNNPKGFWEDSDLNALNVEMLTALDSDWFHLAPIGAIHVEALRKQGYFLRAVDLLSQKVGGVAVFGFKDPRVAKMLPFWKEVFNHCNVDVSYVLAIRHPLSVVKSLAKRDGIAAEQSYLLWLGHVIAALIGSAGDKRVLVDYDRLMRSPDAELIRISKCIDLEIDRKELQVYKTEFLDQGLRHTVFEPNELLLDDACPPIVREVYDALRDVASDKVTLDDQLLQRKVSHWSDEFERIKAPLMLIDRLFTQKRIATQAVAERDAQISSLSQAVTERDAQITSLSQTVTERDAQINSLSQAVAERDAQIASLSQAVTERDGQIASLTQAVAERDNQIASLNQAVTERDGQIASLSQDLKMMIASKSWQITRPLRWSALQVWLLREHGLSARFHAFVRRGIRGVSRRGLDYVRARPELRVRLHGWALKLGLKEQLHALYGKVQTQATEGVPNLRDLVVSSYQAWCEHFDTPSMETMGRLAATSESKSPVIVVARFEKASESYAETLAQRLVDSVGQAWNAVFLFSSDCNAAETIRKISLATNRDARIEFDAAAVNRDAEIAIFVEGGALPRLHALRIFADTLRNSPEALLAYADEDLLFDGGLPRDPWFKPEFSPLLASQGLLVGRMVAFKVGGAESVGVLEKLLSTSIDAAGFARDYVIALGKRRVLHIPHVLFHDAFARRAPIVHEWSLPEILPKATIIIPTKDRWDLLGPCLDSLWLSDWPTELLDIIVVDNGSTDSKTLTMLRKLESESRIRVIRDARQFNWSRLNNLAVQESDGELLVFLNNDTEIDDRAWLKKMTAHALRPGVGAVGCKLLYPDRTVQHGGVVAGIQGVAGHAHLFLQASEGGYCNLANITREVSAVTGACLAVTRKNFQLAGGFDENFRVAFNDVMFCFSLHSLGLSNIYVADPLLIHYESKSRGYDDTPEKKSLNREETAKAWAKYPSVMRSDPFYSPNLSLFKPYDLSFAPRRRAAWDDPKVRPLRVMLLSVTHSIGHGVPVVLSLQAEALVRRGFEVIVAGPRSAKDFPYPDCTRLEVHDPIDAAVFAADLSVDVVIVHTMPFFNITKWTGMYPAVICYDHGEPPSDWFPDAEARKAALLEKDLSLTMATAVYAISDAIAAESRVPVTGVIPEGNTHLGQWNEGAKERRNRVRRERGWNDHFVILNVCRFHVGERIYKGIDTFVSVFDACKAVNHDQSNKLIFVLCGKGTPDDVAEMTRCGLLVQANVSNDEMLDLYCAADAYANFSKWEGYNLGVAQALAMGLPTIASDIPAHRAFGIHVSNDVDDAANWVLQTARKNEPREPRVWEWDKPLAQLIEVIENVSVKNPD